MPDMPYSLFEGLAGTVCAWAEACTVVEARMRKMQLEAKGEAAAAVWAGDKVFQASMLRHLGFPGFGGYGPRGLF